MSALRILDCTLRDGSYVVDFQFTAEDTVVLLGGLEAAGIDLIEIGHGLGLHASSAGKGAAASSDEEYLSAAASSVSRAEWGMFFIPGIGRLEDLDLASRYRMKFVRIGTNAGDVAEAQPFIERAKSLGMMVSANLMKSYGLSPGDLAARAADAARYGCDVVALVDSAGTMLPSDIARYMRALKDSVGVPIGFHGHDNLRLAVANTLTAIECGATIVDSTLQGIGRSGGNAATEVLVAILKRQEVDLHVDLHRLMDLSNRVVRPLLHSKGVDPLEVTAGYAGFHSSYLTTILEHASRYDIDPRDLIEAVCEVNQVGAPADLVDRTARHLREQRARGTGVPLDAVVPPPRLRAVSTEPAPTFDATMRRLAETLRTRARKSGHQSVVNVVAASTARGTPLVSDFVQEQFGFVIGSVEVDRPVHVEAVVAAVDGVVDALLIDSELKPYLDRPLSTFAAPQATALYLYKDNDVLVRTVAQQIDATGASALEDTVVVCGADSSALKLTLALTERAFHVVLTGESAEVLDRAVDTVRAMAVGTVRLCAQPDMKKAASSARLFVPFTQRAGTVDQGIVDALRPDTIVFVAHVGAVTPDAIEAGLAKDVRFVRPDMRAAIGAELSALVGSRRLATELMGRSTIASVPVVAGGFIGRRGDVVVDSISRPSCVLGIADGRGSVMYGPSAEFADRIAAVEAEVWRHRFL